MVNLDVKNIQELESVDEETSPIYPFLGFIHHSQSGIERPALLLMDNHTSHKLQPLGQSCYRKFKAYYNSVCKTWMTKNPGQSISIYDIAELVGTALTSTNIISGFRVARIWSWDRHVFAEEEFLAAEVTNRPDPSGTP
ncbi:hypothetical protein QYM36_010673 [Artemia franciscana]|uniref:DDE-1 domain-containing protein n=1 Tax=Artemia franciscana TaxID=6661 RepID=A0AA88L4C2_ARTSF|nr:hypothetical protein QYM36_010673 [Artemia franciscana]